MLLQEAGKGAENNNNNNKPQHPSEIDENRSKYGFAVADTATQAGPKTQKASSGTTLNTDWTRFLCQLRESRRPAPDISRMYSWKLSDLFCSLPGAWKMTCKHGDKAFHSQYRLTFIYLFF